MFLQLVSNPIITINYMLIAIIIGGNVDYYSGIYNITFPAGDTSVSFNVTINDDNMLEYNEEFILYINITSLHNNFTVTEGIPNNTEVTIIDNESKFEFIHCV